MGQAGEPVLVEAFIAEAAVEGFDVRVLRRLARRDQPQREAALVRPGEHRAPTELGAVVGAQNVRQSPGRHELLQDARDGEATERPRRHNRDGVGRGVVHNRQALQHPALRRAIEDEVGGPHCSTGGAAAAVGRAAAPSSAAGVSPAARLCVQAGGRQLPPPTCIES
jgi:hypothetical protein